MIFGIDAHGGDYAPKEIVEGVCNHAKKQGQHTFVLYGQKQVLETYDLPENVLIEDCSQIITNNDMPTVAIRRMKDSSMVRGLRDLKEKKIQGFLSAGSTGALLVGGMFITGRIKGIKRPALTSAFPTMNGFCVVSDMGANADCQPEFLLSFAQMASIYAKEVLDVSHPQVALLNVGAEAEKGNELSKKAYALLEASDLNFIGNIEARDIIFGKADVVIHDGFTGNIMIKTTEGVAAFFTEKIKELFMTNALTKASSIFFRKGLKELKASLDYREYGGAPFLGVNGPLVKAHGTSDAKAIESALIYLEKYASRQVIERIRDLYDH